MSSEERERLDATKPTGLGQGQDLGKPLGHASSIDDFFKRSRATRLALRVPTLDAGARSGPYHPIGIRQEDRRINLGEYVPRRRSLMLGLAFALGAVTAAGGIYFFHGTNPQRPPPPDAIAAMPPLPPQSATVAAPPPPPVVASRAPAVQPTAVEAVPAASSAPKPAVPMPDQAKLNPLEPDRTRLSPSEIAEVQARLESLGMNPGPGDGVWGPQTAAAIRRYEESKGQPHIGKVDRELLERLRQEPN